jgi:hypothetical protein
VPVNARKPVDSTEFQKIMKDFIALTMHLFYFQKSFEALSKTPPIEQRQKESVNIQRTIRYALSLSLSLVLVLLLYVGDIMSLLLLDTMENHACDARLKLITVHTVGKQVVIVDID